MAKNVKVRKKSNFRYYGFGVFRPFLGGKWDNLVIKLETLQLFSIFGSNRAKIDKKMAYFAKFLPQF